MNSENQSTSNEDMTKITVTQLLPMVYQDAMQPGVKQLGTALGSVLSLVPTLMLPLKYVSEAAKLLLGAHLNELRQKLESRKPEDVRPVAPEIGVPVIEKLLHTQDKQLASLYLQLLAQASDRQGQQFAHPSFVHLISQLSPDEAALLQLFADRDSKGLHPYVVIHLVQPGIVDGVLRGPLTLWENKISLIEPNNVPAYVVNLIRCGLLHDEPGIPLAWDTDQPDTQAFESLKAHYAPLFGQPMQIGSRLDWTHGTVRLTEFGRLFIECCVVPTPELLTGVSL